MDDMEIFKLKLQIAADTKEVRLGQTKDHLIWRVWRTDDAGERHPANFFVFEMNFPEDDTRDRIICIEKASGPFHDTEGNYWDRDAFLDWAQETYGKGAWGS